MTAVVKDFTQREFLIFRALLKHERFHYEFRCLFLLWRSSRSKIKIVYGWWDVFVATQTSERVIKVLLVIEVLPGTTQKSVLKNGFYGYFAVNWRDELWWRVTLRADQASCWCTKLVKHLYYPIYEPAIHRWETRGTKLICMFRILNVNSMCRWFDSRLFENFSAFFLDSLGWREIFSIAFCLVYVDFVDLNIIEGLHCLRSLYVTIDCAEKMCHNVSVTCANVQSG